MACSIFIAASSGDLATTPVSRLQTSWWKERFTDKQVELIAHPSPVVWLGDSITQDWERDGSQSWLQFRSIWKRLYGSIGAVNLGFKGDSTCHLLWRLENGELSAMHPKVIVLLIGANNFGHIHTAADETAHGILSIVSLLTRHLPRTKVIVLGILPSIRSRWVDVNTIQANNRVKAAIANMTNVVFVDASPIFMKNGSVDPNQFIDPRLEPPQPALHPTAQAQERIADLINPLIGSALR